MSSYIANGTMYGCSNTFSNPFRGIETKPFKTSVNKLYDFMLQRCLDRTKEYKDYDDTDDWDSLDFTILRHMQREMHEDNPLSVILSDNSYYFNDVKGIRRIDKYEGS